MANKFSFLGAVHSNMIEIMYDQYIENPESVNKNGVTSSQVSISLKVYSEEDEVQKLLRRIPSHQSY